MAMAIENQARSKCGGTFWTLEQIKMRIIDEGGGNIKC
jgi:hypothetical protein